jgi:hypothetical protein
LGRPIPDKGKVLTGLSHYWFQVTDSICPNHCVSVHAEDLPDVGDDLAGRAMLCVRAQPIPIEFVVRGYLSGSAWAEYRARGTLAGEPLPAGLCESDRLEPTLFSPATKAEAGHDLNVTFTTIHMPLVRTPMIAPTKLYDKFPTISPAQAADVLVRAMVEKPHEINTALGNAGAIAHTVAPKAAFRLLNLAYHVFPDSAAAKGKSAEGGTRESEQIMLARVFKGVHW